MPPSSIVICLQKITTNIISRVEGIRIDVKKANETKYPTSITYHKKPAIAVK